MSGFTWLRPPPRQLLQGKRSFRNQQVFIQRLLHARESRGGWGCSENEGPQAPALVGGHMFWWDRHHLGQVTSLWDPDLLAHEKPIYLGPAGSRPSQAGEEVTGT